MKLEKNVTPPIFVLEDVFERMVDLNTYQDKRILIAFFRHAGCPFCNLRVHSLMKIHEELKSKGMLMVFFFESKKEIILRSSFHRGVSPVPIISDPNKVWYDKYGLESSGYKSTLSHFSSFVQTAYKAYKSNLPMHLMAGGESINTIPAEFLVDKGLLVKKVHYSQRLNDRILINDVRRFAHDGTVSE